jgi:hypothetical protein
MMTKLELKFSIFKMAAEQTYVTYISINIDMDLACNTPFSLSVLLECVIKDYIHVVKFKISHYFRNYNFNKLTVMDVYKIQYPRR